MRHISNLTPPIACFRFLIAITQWSLCCLSALTEEQINHLQISLWTTRGPAARLILSPPKTIRGALFGEPLCVRVYGRIYTHCQSLRLFANRALGVSERGPIQHYGQGPQCPRFNFPFHILPRRLQEVTTTKSPARDVKNFPFRIRIEHERLLVSGSFFCCFWFCLSPTTSCVFMIGLISRAHEIAANLAGVWFRLSRELL